MNRVSVETPRLEVTSNVYVFDTDRTLLIDTGSKMSKGELGTKLARLDITLDEVDEVLLTHWHPDHAGLASTLYREAGSVVYVHKDDVSLVRRGPDAWERLHARQRECLRVWGVPSDERETAMCLLEDERDRPEVPDPSPFSGGFEVTNGETTYRAVHTPGHTAGSTSFAVDCGDDSLLFTGDALLPGYTPNLGGSDLRVTEPLKQYLRTLVEMHSTAYDRVYPGHGPPISDPNARILETIDHHESRAWRVLTTLDRRKVTTVWNLSEGLFGSLSGYHAYIGPAEVAVHLDHLTTLGLVERTDNGYRLTSSGAERTERVADESLPLVERAGSDPCSVL